jgi:hypothetical protein
VRDGLPKAVQPKEYLRQHSRMAKIETEIAERVRALHSGERELLVLHSLPAHRMTTSLVLADFLKQFGTDSVKPETDSREIRTVETPGQSERTG